MTLPRQLAAAVLLLSAPLALPSQARLVLDPGSHLSTIAGSGEDRSTRSGSALEVALGSPRGLVYDTAGDLYIADSRNHQIDRVSPAGALTVFAGDGSQGYTGDGGPATSAALNEPVALALAPDGSLFFADSGNHCIRRVALGTITTAAGTGSPGFSGDGGLATTAKLRSPSGVAFGPDGSLYIADSGNHRIRRLTADGMLTTVAGTGAEDDTGDGGPAVLASFRSPKALQMLADGRLLIADQDARRIRALLSDGTIVAYGTGAAVRRPEGLGLEASGDVLITDAGNHQVLTSGSDASGAVSSMTVAGTGEQGSDVAGLAVSSPMDSPSAAIADGNGNLTISDRRNHQVQQVALASLTFGEVPVGRTSAMQGLTLTNGGGSDLRIDGLQIPAGFAALSDDAGCPVAPFSLHPGASCVAALAFSPIAQGQQTSLLLVRPEGAPPSAVRVSGTGIATGSLAQSVTTLTSNGSISYAGAPVNLAASVSGALSNIPAGNVTILDGNVPLTTVALTGGSATVTTTAMQTGQHTLYAAYSGDVAYAASVSPPLIQTVVPAPDFTVSVPSSSYTGSAGGSLTIPVAVTPVNGTLNQTVTLSVTGLPPGSTCVFSPSIFTLGGAPTSVSMAITLPVTLSRDDEHGAAVTVVCGFPCVLLPGWRRRKRRLNLGFAIAMTTLGIVSLLSTGGCGGFRVSSSSTSTTGAPKTLNYTAVVTATSTGVLGDLLVHSAAINLAVTQ